jgi:hypothetical protein
MDDEQKVSFAWALTLFDSLFSILLSLMRMTFPYHFDFCPVLRDYLRLILLALEHLVSFLEISTQPLEI